MGLFDAFTGDAYKKAASRNAAVIGAAQTAGTNALNTNTDTAINYLGIPLSGGDALGSLKEGYGTARADLGSANDRVQALLGQAGGLYAGLTKGGEVASNARADALGLNGSDGFARAKAAFTGSLGYNAGLDSGLDEIEARAASRGMLSSGTTSRDLFNYAADFQNKQAGSYLDRLGTMADNYKTGLAGEANALAGRASAEQGLGSALATLGSGLGRDSASVYGTGAGLKSQLGQSIAGLQLGGAQAIANSNMTAAQGQTAASGNALGGILGLGSAFLGAGGQAGGFAKLFGG